MEGDGDGDGDEAGDGDGGESGEKKVGGWRRVERGIQGYEIRGFNNLHNTTEK